MDNANLFVILLENNSFSYNNFNIRNVSVNFNKYRRKATVQRHSCIGFNVGKWEKNTKKSKNRYKIKEDKKFQ